MEEPGNGASAEADTNASNVMTVVSHGALQNRTDSMLNTFRHSGTLYKEAFCTFLLLGFVYSHCDWANIYLTCRANRPHSSMQDMCIAAVCNCCQGRDSQAEACEIKGTSWSSTCTRMNPGAGLSFHSANCDVASTVPILALEKNILSLVKASGFDRSTYDFEFILSVSRAVTADFVAAIFHPPQFADTVA